MKRLDRDTLRAFSQQKAIPASEESQIRNFASVAASLSVQLTSLAQRLPWHAAACPPSILRDGLGHGARGY